MLEYPLAMEISSFNFVKFFSKVGGGNRYRLYDFFRHVGAFGGGCVEVGVDAKISFSSTTSSLYSVDIAPPFIVASIS